MSNRVPSVIVLLAAILVSGSVLAAPPDAADVPELRALGPVGLERALAAWTEAGRPDDPAWLRFVDEVAGQYGATASRLFWFTDREAALALARESGKPVVSLRLLGNLTEPYSCANSRFFRAIVYSDPQVSDWLREHVVLHWSSERPVPLVTIDFGDGRMLKRTLTGNSAHYVLDAEGRPIDVLPGLYAPREFLERLNAIETLIASLPASGEARAWRLSVYHAERTVELAERLRDRLSVIRPPSRVPSAAYFRAAVLAPPPTRTFVPAAVAATFSRAKGGYGSIVNGGESTLLARLGLGAPPPRPSLLPTDEEWREISRILFGQQPLSRAARERIAAELPAWSDATTIATAQAVTNGPEWTGDSSAVNSVDPLTGRHMQQVDPKSIEELEVISLGSLGPPTMLELREGWLRLSVIEDTERNELLLHPRIHERLAADPLLDFESLNRWVYASVFLTPREDPWLGLVDPSIHTALPGDGIVAAGN